MQGIVLKVEMHYEPPPWQALPHFTVRETEAWEALCFTQGHLGSVELDFEPRSTPRFFPLLPIFSMSDSLVLSTALLPLLPSLPIQPADHSTNKN